MYDPSCPGMSLPTHQRAPYPRHESRQRSQRNEEWLWPILIEFGDRVLKELPEESDLNKCGFCMSPIESFRGRGNFCQVRIGRCGHLFHAQREHLQSGTSCFNRMTEASRVHRGYVSCEICRRNQTKRKRSRSNELSDGECHQSHQRERSPERSRTKSISSE